jgi:hypothetical protein
MILPCQLTGNELMRIVVFAAALISFAFVLTREER